MQRAFIYSPYRTRKRRFQIGLTLREVGTACGLSWQTIRNYECGAHAPSADALGRLAVVLDCRVDDLFTLRDAGE